MSEAAASAVAGTGKAKSAGFAARIGFWLVAVAIIVALPLVFKSGLALTMMSLMGISIVFALSYNILLGQTGMLSFGHAVYYGLGAYFTVHAMNAATALHLPIPLPLMPIVGGGAGLIFAMIFGWVSTKRSGTAFAMISLGLAELVGSSSLILRSFFGGEEGVSTNRTALPALFGWTFGPQIQVYYLIAGWCLVSAAIMYGLTRTPLGRMCNAVRENAQRAAFVGYNPRMVRYMAFSFAGLFGGVAGALAAINFELANSALFSAAQSGTVLFAAFVGGASAFFGPILGAILVTYLQTMLSDVTDVWQLYFGILFIATVMFAPGGIARLILMHRPIMHGGGLLRLIPAYVLGLIVILGLAAGLILAIEMTAHLAMKASEGTSITLIGFSFDTLSTRSWTIAGGLILAGVLGLRLVSAPVSGAWDRALQASQARRQPA